MSIYLDNGDTLVGQASASASIAVALYGRRQTHPDHAKIDQRQVPNIATTLYTSTGEETVLDTIVVTNPTAGSVSIKLWHDGSSDTFIILPEVVLGAGEFAVFSEDGWKFHTSAGAIKTADAAGGIGAAIANVEVTLAPPGVLRRQGTFIFTAGSGLTPGTPVSIQQANGPYTGKGTREDEAEMDIIEVTGKVLNTTQIQCFWESETFVQGAYKFNYFIGAGGAPSIGSVPRMLKEAHVTTPFSSSILENTLFTYTIPANSLAIGDVLKFHAWGRVFGNNLVAATNWVWRMKLGTTTLHQTPNIAYSDSGAQRAWVIDFEMVVESISAQRSSIVMLGTATGQDGQGWTFFGTGESFLGYNQGAESLAADKALALTVQMDQSSVDDYVDIRGASLVRIPAS